MGQPKIKICFPKILPIIFLLLGSLAGICSAADPALYYFAPIYWVTATVNDSPDAAAEGHQIVFYKILDEYYAGIYASDLVGSGGSAKAANRGMVNTFANKPEYPLAVGGSYFAAVVQDDKGYGAGPVVFTVSGKGYDETPPMTMALGAGVPPPPSAGLTTTPPIFKEIWFGNRLYHKALVEKGEKFITSKTPTIKAQLEGTGSSGILKSSIEITANKGQATEATFKISDSELKDVQYLAGSAGVASSLNFEYAIAPDEALPDGANVLVFSAKDALGLVATQESAYIEVMSGPLAVIGPVVCYPSPFSPEKNGQVEIQYTLNNDGDVQIFLYAISGELIKRLYLKAGQEGGSAGVNKVKWDGKTTFGELAGNGIYVGTIFYSQDNKTLAKFKLTVVH